MAEESGNQEEEDGWGPWETHMGQHYPFTRVTEVWLRGNDFMGGIVETQGVFDPENPDEYGWIWDKAGIQRAPDCHCGHCLLWVIPIIAYRIRRPGSMKLIRSLLEPRNLEEFRKTDNPLLEPVE